ncbi:phosphoribosylanthranilate isomerase [Hymenobacter weizhouensis]|uniref:phosphoribosylanthranilate isomerase n=1 Tax=Hymenobacter sp. YIM 151500-1 TaxID=2987689 RepID=UPI0022267A86|nr:phosphoribosylanthranilate isomerase [Hymenobacter sp. YIM 151500-1]UYZ64605.1 phosphoribosylanthranilate isomerase [Hymenobacter sp. YIM 151500-1]
MPPQPLLKVCGMARADNLAAVVALRPDFLGFIFYPKSGRYMGRTLSPAALAQVPPAIRKVGVFVDAPVDEVLARVAEFGLNLVQLHGAESPATCAALRAVGVAVVKAFSVGETFDLARLTPYLGNVDYFLFDTQGRQPGGNGTAFDWGLLAGYNLPVPYFLAGGLDLTHAAALRNLRLPGLFALDLNSRFETAPGVKDTERLRQFFTELRT